MGLNWKTKRCRQYGVGAPGCLSPQQHGGTEGDYLWNLNTLFESLLCHSGSVTLDQLPNLSEPQFLHLYNKENGNCLMGLLRKLNETRQIHIKQSPAHSRFSRIVGQFFSTSLHTLFSLCQLSPGRCVPTRCIFFVPPSWEPQSIFIQIQNAYPAKREIRTSSNL